MATVSGNLSDLELEPLSGRFPRLFFRLDRPAATGSNVIVTAKVQAIVDDTTGAFTVSVVSTDELIPAGVRYTITADWDAGQSLDVLTGLRIPLGDWTMADLIAYKGIPEFGSDLTWIGPNAPDETRQWMWWINTSVVPAELWEWSD